MFLIKIYFILGLAMLLAVLWDFKIVPKTSSLLIKQAGDTESGFALIINAIRNLLVMGVFAFFFWPAVVWLEYRGESEK
ncbi:hypothetical protein [Sideroxydans sp. CL21]|uniref:hypothetical protein n=1 Tax=Sideroxydans sp. CL21 TaxID=2600596 RepID=UPI0012AA0104|nr:hypothetical protein [Sideroxydans sp. CL21]VVC83515.1 hypothetical protein [Sideroxydans sp. CL21]